VKQSPTSRSMAYLRERGLSVCKVEQRLPIPGKFVTRDAFNFGDLLCAEESFGIALIQVTSGANIPARIEKIIALPEAKEWLFANGRILVHGWSKKGKRGERKTWQLRSIEIFYDEHGVFQTTVLDGTI
jgi:hypothetical protein